MTGYPGDTAAAVLQLVPCSQLKHQRNIREMCLNELDLSQFLSENSPVPHDVNFEVFDNFTSSETFKAHRYQIFMLKYNHYAQHKYPLEGTFKETLTLTLIKCHISLKSYSRRAALNSAVDFTKAL